MRTSKNNRLLRGTLAERRGAATCIAMLALLGTAVGCSEQKSAAAAPTRSSSAQPSEASVPSVLANVGDDKITIADVRARVGDELDQLQARYEQNRIKLISTTLNNILRDKILTDEAKKQGKTAEQLIAAEAGGSLEPNEVEIAAWYQANQDRVVGRTLDQLRTQIADYLRNERRAKAAEKLEARLNQERNVAIHLEPYRATLNNEGAPAVGPENAAVTFVEFSDFQCPFCSRFFPTLKQVEEKYKDRVRIVYRQYPIPSLHPYAFKAAEASLCAHEQGKFWQLHDAMFQDQNKLAIRDLKDKAARLGVDQKKFDGCLDSGKYTEKVQEDLRDGARAGVTGTPALFVNGVPIDGGAVGFDLVAKAIDKELARAKK
jgi:protein-disulfide isomerase